MTESQRWERLLTLPAPGAHVVQVYQDQGFLTDAVCRFICAGLQQNDAIIVVATQAHRDSFAARLELDGFGVTDAVQRGQLTFLDAAHTLAGFMENGMPEWSSFQQYAAATFELVPKRYSFIRAYGEISELLLQSGQQEAAETMERFWNDFVRSKQISVMCSYFVDPLDSKFYGCDFQGICKHHSHLVSCSDYDKFTAAVGDASEEILGASVAGMLQSAASMHRPRTDMASGQAILLYMSEHMPAAAFKVMNRVRELEAGQ